MTYYLPRPLLFPLLVLVAAAPVSGETIRPELSGIHPHLAMFNENAECGTGAVVVWADRLWAVTYAPHKPGGSDDKLYSVTRDLTLTIHPESIGGTPANRMIHHESEQLFIGPYAVGKDGKVRPISYDIMPGRPTGNARHLFDPQGKIYYATMEEGIYEVDVKSLAVTELFADDQKQSGPAPEGRRFSSLPGYHGKGLYSGQGVLVYSNNGEKSQEARSNPRIPSGVLAEWDGKSDEWTVVRRNQFVEVTGPGGIEGNRNPATDPIWATGWDNKSVLLAVREPATGWSFFRLPKSSHSYDGAHGWNTEWPRIREIGEEDFLMTMHGSLWRFPKTFGSRNSAGIAPRSNYLKVIGDFALWGGHVVFGCDDTAKAEFLNKREAKGEIPGAQSQSNFWFVKPEQLDTLGPVIGRGMVWEDEDVAANTPSDPFLFAGYEHRCLHIAHENPEPLKVVLEVDPTGTGEWQTLREIEAAPSGHILFDPSDAGVWIRLRTKQDAKQITAAFSYRNADPRGTEAAALFDGLAKPGQPLTGGIVRALDDKSRNMAFAAIDASGAPIGYYELDESLTLKPAAKEGAPKWATSNVTIPGNDFLVIDEASAIFLDEDGKRWRLPKGNIGSHPLGSYRVAREIVTERDLFNIDGTLYEVPARNAGGFIKARPVATHNRLIHDLCGYRGLLVISGIATDAPASNPHILRSTDGKTALWAGGIDDLWKLGKPRGIGGPWKDTAVKAGEPSDPYLMTAYDKKSLTLKTSAPATITAEIDITGNGDWTTYRTFKVDGETSHVFPEAFSAYWIRFRSNQGCTATATLLYQ
jgi:hypothetical protein